MAHSVRMAPRQSMLARSGQKAPALSIPAPKALKGHSDLVPSKQGRSGHLDRKGRGQSKQDHSAPMARGLWKDHPTVRSGLMVQTPLMECPENPVVRKDRSVPIPSMLAQTVLMAPKVPAQSSLPLSAPKDRLALEPLRPAHLAPMDQTAPIP